MLFCFGTITVSVYNVAVLWAPKNKRKRLNQALV